MGNSTNLLTDSVLLALPSPARGQRIFVSPCSSLLARPFAHHGIGGAPHGPFSTSPKESPVSKAGVFHEKDGQLFFSTSFYVGLTLTIGIFQSGPA